MILSHFNEYDLSKLVSFVCTLLLTLYVSWVIILGVIEVFCVKFKKEKHANKRICILTWVGLELH